MAWWGFRNKTLTRTKQTFMIEGGEAIIYCIIDYPCHGLELKLSTLMVPSIIHHSHLHSSNIFCPVIKKPAYIPRFPRNVYVYIVQNPFLWWGILCFLETAIIWLHTVAFSCKASARGSFSFPWYTRTHLSFGNLTHLMPTIGWYHSPQSRRVVSIKDSIQFLLPVHLIRTFTPH